MSESLTVPEMLRRCAQERPDDTAIESLPWGSLSYGEWASRSARAARRLADLGVEPGVRVIVVCAADWTAYAVAYMAVLWTGGTAVPVAAAMGDAHIAWAAAESRSAGVIGEEPIDGVAGWRSTLTALESPPGREAAMVRVEPGCVAEILYTSGTTGVPKGIAATHENLVWLLRQGNARPADRPHPKTVMHSLPAGSNGGQTLLLQSLSHVPHLVVTLRFAAHEFLSAIKSQRPDEIVLVPAHAISLIRAAKEQRYDLGSVRVVRNTSAAISPATLADLAALFPEAVISNVYTSTEAWPARARMTYDPARASSVGCAGESTPIRIVGDDGAPVPVGQVGHVEIRMPGAPSRWYDGDPKSSAAVFRPGGWVRTGDRGRLDDDSFLYLEGRTTEIINSGGQNVSPLEIDAALEEHPAVIEACAFAVPHPTLGAYVACAVRVGREIELHELYEWSEARLGPLKAPKRIHVVDEFPRTATGKPLRAQLARILAGGERGAVDESNLFEGISRVWRDGLALDSLPDAGADFLNLGGSSLEAAEITAEVRRLSGRAVRERALYQCPTLAEYVQAVLGADPVSDGDLRATPAEQEAHGGR